MDQPLDLSQRDQEISGSRMDTEDNYCQYVNCTCPLRHISPIESQSSGYVGPLMGHINPMRFLPGFYADSMVFDTQIANVDTHITNPNTKRTSAPDIRTFSTALPKRRRIEQCSHTISRSASDESLTSGSNLSVQTFFRPGFPAEENGPINNEINHQNRTVSGSAKVPEKTLPIPQNNSHAFGMTEINRGMVTSDDTLEKRERSKTVSKKERLPMKKLWARHFSQDNSYKQSQILKPSTVTGPVISHSSGNDVTSNLSYEQSRPQMDTLFIPGQEDSSSSSSSSSSPSLECDSDTSSRRKSPITHEELKADMIREIDDSNKQEATLKKKPSSYLYDKISESAKLRQVEGSMNPGGCRMTALDYLISKTLLQKEDKPYKARNNHIHQILRGEKPGKLCLMDIVELQVEIGLA